jgi:channel protein (hemolysin III family)
MPIHPSLGFAEPVSAWSHLAGALVALAAARPLIRRADGRRGHALALAVFAASAVVLLTVSGVYHTVPSNTAAHAVLRRLDHAAIFVLIAGTFTPVHTIVFRGAARWAVLLAIWGLAVTGLVVKTVFFAAIPESLGLGIFLLFGWLGVASGYALWQRFGFAFIRPALWGAFAYTIGALIGFAGEPTLVPGYIGSHELFHGAALIGLYGHWRFIQSVADG